jgi:hypothetical protein
VQDKRGHEVMHTAPVSEDDARFLRERVLPTLQALDDETYLDGPAMILHTGARFSYVLDGDDLLWCVEWEPGLLVVRFSPDGRMAWTALRSPVPGFGGRKPLKQDLERYDEDADDPQYNLVFHAWDAQFDEFSRTHFAFVPASEDAQRRYAAGLRAACQRRVRPGPAKGLRLKLERRGCPRRITGRCLGRVSSNSASSCRANTSMFRGRSVSPFSMVRLTVTAPTMATHTCPGASPYGLPEGPAAPLSQMPQVARWLSRMRAAMRRA